MKHTVGATEKSVRILELICERDGIRMSEICSKLELSKSSVYSHLQTLHKAGFIIKEGEQYFISVRMLWFAEHARTRKDEYELAREKVDQLVTETGEEATFAVPENYRPVVYYQALPTGDNPTFLRGKRTYMHDAAVGKVMLAEFSDDEIQKAIDLWGLPESTEHTIAKEEALYEEVEQVREQGYATLNEEFANGLRAVATSVMYPENRLFGALSIIVPAYRVSVDALESKLAPKVIATANELERQIVDQVPPYNER
jgi:DNA-binding IclR family transcriptional regulator